MIIDQQQCSWLIVKIMRARKDALDFIWLREDEDTIQFMDCDEEEEHWEIITN